MNTVLLHLAPTLLGWQDFGPARPAPGDDAAAFAAMMTIFIVAGIIGLIVGLAIQAFICYLLKLCIERVPAQFQQMEPWKVWLLMIPCFHLYWNFVVYAKIPQSYQAYFASTGDPRNGDCGQQLGLWYAICSIAAIVPVVNYIAGPAGLVLLIIVLVKFFDLRKQIPVKVGAM